jgi:phosphoglycolate phosphatase-like HAD superfamily hydrolase
MPVKKSKHRLLPAVAEPLKPLEPIKVVGLDIYGTVLRSRDPIGSSLRPGIERFFDNCSSNGIYIVTASDANTPELQTDLVETFKKHGIFHLVARIFDYYQLNQWPHKEYTALLQFFSITETPSRLLVIGDSSKDIGGAKACRARWIRCPEYFALEDCDKFDFGKIDLKTGTYAV